MKIGLVLTALVLISQQAAAEPRGGFDCVAYSDFERTLVKTDVMRGGAFNLYEKLRSYRAQISGQ